MKKCVAKNLKLLPIAVYPYLIAAGAFIVSMIGRITDDSSGALLAMMIISSAVYVYSVVVAVLNIVAAFKGKADGYETPKFTLIAKCLHIPAYVILFVAGLLSFVMSVWGIGLLLLVTIASALLIFISGLVGVGGVIAARKAGYITTVECVIYCILGFVYVFDFIFAIILLCRTRPKQPEQVSAGCLQEGTR